jgi:MFS family permease
MRLSPHSLPLPSTYSRIRTKIHFILRASAVGRYAAGLIADRYGRFNAMLMTQILSIVVTFALGVPITNQLPLLYIFAAGFGFSTGCVISLAPVCFGQLCHASQYGLYYGTGYSMVSFT